MYEDEDGRNWDKRIQQIQFALNDAENKTTRKTPHQLLFGYHPRNALQNQVALAVSKLNYPEDIEDLRTEAVQRIAEQQLKDKRNFDQKHKRPRIYNVDDLVLVKRELGATGQSRKLLPKYKGPYVVTRVLGNDRYVINDVPGAQRTSRPFNAVFCSGLMKPWCTNLEEDSQDTSSSSDEEEDKEYHEAEGTPPVQEGRVVSDHTSPSDDSEGTR